MTWHELIQYKVIHRLHYSCVKLYFYYPSLSLVFNANNLMECWLVCFSSAPDSRFWSEVFHCYSDVNGFEVTTAGNSKSLENFVNAVWNVHSQGLEQRDITLFGTWLTEFSSSLCMEKILYEMSGKAS